MYDYHKEGLDRLIRKGYKIKSFEWHIMDF